MGRTYRRDSIGRFKGGGGGSGGGGAAAAGGGKVVITKGVKPAKSSFATNAIVRNQGNKSGAFAAKFVTGGNRESDKVALQATSRARRDISAATRVKAVPNKNITNISKGGHIETGTAGFTIRGRKTPERLSGDKARDIKTLSGRVKKGEAASAKADLRHREANFSNRYAANASARISANRGTTAAEGRAISAGNAAKGRLKALESRKDVGGKTISQQAMPKKTAPAKSTAAASKKQGTVSAAAVAGKKKGIGGVTTDFTFKKNEKARRIDTGRIKAITAEKGKLLKGGTPANLTGTERARFDRLSALSANIHVTGVNRTTTLANNRPGATKTGLVRKPEGSGTRVQNASRTTSSDKVKNAATMFGTGSTQHKQAQAKFSTGTAAKAPKQSDFYASLAGKPGTGVSTTSHANNASDFKKAAVSDSKSFYGGLAGKSGTGVSKAAKPATSKLNPASAASSKVKVTVTPAMKALKDAHGARSPQYLAAYRQAHKAAKAKNS